MAGREVYSSMIMPGLKCRLLTKKFSVHEDIYVEFDLVGS